MRSRAISAASVAAATASAPFGLCRYQRRPCSVWSARRASTSASSVRPGHASALLRYSGRACSTAWSAVKASADAAAAGSASSSPGATNSRNCSRAASMSVLFHLVKRPG